MATMQDTSETSGRLIAADKVEGTTVYNSAGEKLGSVEDIMLDKMSGKACYAVLSFGGFLGMGTKQYPLPWEKLTYDTNMGGFVVNIDKPPLRARRFIPKAECATATGVPSIPITMHALRYDG